MLTLCFLLLANGVASPSFEEAVLLAEVEGVQGVFAEDLDNDGLDDVVWVSPEGVTWSRSLGSGDFEAPALLDELLGFCTAVDMDGDGDLDVMGYGTWYEGAGDGSFTAHPFDAEAGSEDCWVDDLDGDGDLDVMYAEYWNPPAYWYANLGDGVFGPPEELPHAAGQDPRGWGVASGDLDGDGVVDVLTGIDADLGGGLTWAKGLGGGAFGEPSGVRVGGVGCETADLDGDGDVDVLSGAFWAENLGGAQFNDGQTIFDDHLAATAPFDFDGDGDLDIVMAGNDGPLGWFEFDNGAYGGIHEVSGELSGWVEVALGDLDNDGRVDILTGERLSGEVALYLQGDEDGTRCGCSASTGAGGWVLGLMLAVLRRRRGAVARWSEPA